MSALIFVLALVAVTPLLAAVGRWQVRRDVRRLARQRLQMQLDEMNRRYAALATEIGTALLPAVRSMAEAMGRLARSLQHQPKGESR